MNRRSVTVGLVQMSAADGKADNSRKAAGLIEQAARRGAEIVALPELFATPYFCRKAGDSGALSLAEPIPGPTSEALGRLAARHGIVLIGGSIFEQAAGGKRFNTACVFGPDGAMLGTYRKSHIPHDPGFYEQDYFSPGDTGIVVHETPAGKIAVLICYDQWFPEAARIAALKGAELIVYPTAIGRPRGLGPVTDGIADDWKRMWRSVQVGHAAANCVYVASVNRVGTEGDTDFWGGSFVADPGATILARADDQEQVVMAACDFEHVKRMQESWRFFAERRPAMYGELTRERQI
jgi:predicted amidohydrolase